LIFLDPKHAQLKASFTWESPHLKQSGDAAFQFEKVGRGWYSADFNVLQFNWAQTILMLLVGVSYAGVSPHAGLFHRPGMGSIGCAAADPKPEN
jgi:hypothetical protein